MDLSQHELVNPVPRFVSVSLLATEKFIVSAVSFETVSVFMFHDTSMVKLVLAAVVNGKSFEKMKSVPLYDVDC